MSDPSAPTPTGHQRTTGGNFRWEPPTAEELQAMMPGYTIEKILGRGGMGAVYKGVQTNLDRTVAIKVLPPGVEKEDPSFAERFKSEAKLMAKLNHPAVVAVYDFGTTLGGQLYFAMEYVDGSDVSQMIRSQGKLPPEHALAITAHVCDALSAAHELGIVHRDIKPANVLLNMKGQVKVADFGLAKVEEPGQHGLTKTGYAMGTPDFVAPEVLMLGSRIDGRADLYAVGVMLYQMLTGEVPRGAFKPATTRLPGLDPRFDPIILKAMQSDREERYQSSVELRRDLDVILTVPLVRQDEPPTSAIPAAQVAQTPAQRSAAQKPPARSADAPVRQPAKAGEGARAPIPPKKSSAPLLLGLGAIAAVGIGAFVMFTGSDKAKQSGPLSPLSGTSGPSTPDASKPSPPKTVATGQTIASKDAPSQGNPTTTAKPVNPQPATNTAPATYTPIAAANWQRVERTPARWKESGFEVKDGWVSFLSSPGGSQKAWVISNDIKGKIPRDVAVRVRFRKENGGHVSLQCRYDTAKPVPDAIFWDDGRFQLRISTRLPVAMPKMQEAKMAKPAVGEEGILELAVIGQRVIARLNSSTVLEREVPGMSSVGPFELRSGGHWIRDAEYLNLDGVADPLKALGWNVPAVSPAVASTTAAPASSGTPQNIPSAPKLNVPIPEWLQNARQEGGRLAFAKSADVPELFDLGEAAKFDDFVEVHVQSRLGWLARRKNGEIWGRGWNSLGKSRLIGPLKSRSISRAYQPHLVDADGKVIWFSGETQRTEQEVLAATVMALGHSPDQDGQKGNSEFSMRILLDAQNRTLALRGTSNGLKPPPADFFVKAPVVSAMLRCFLAAEPGQPLRSWNMQTGVPCPLKEAPTDVVEMDSGSYTALILRSNGEVLHIHQDGQVNSTGSAPPPPAELTPAIRVRSGSLVPAAQKSDGTWIAWNLDPKSTGQSDVVSLVKGIGPAVDLEVGAFTDPQQRKIHYAIYIIPKSVADTPVKTVATAASPAPSPPVSSSPPPATTVAAAAPASELDQRLAALDSSFQTAVERDANAAFKASIAALDKLYLTALDRALTAATQGGKLEEAIALREEKQRIEKGQGVPSEVDESTQAPGKVPDSLKTLRKTYRSTTAQHEATKAKAMQPLYDKYDQALAAVQTELTKANQLDDAMRVKTVREQIAATRGSGEGSAGTPARTTSTGGAASPMTEVDKSVRTPLGSTLLATKDNPFTNRLGMKFVPVPGTDILMCIHETRRQDYAAFASIEAGVNESWKSQERAGIPSGHEDNHPVVGVNWEEASKFCTWLSEKEGKTYRLPTDREWSVAVGIGRDEKWKPDTTPETVPKITTEFPWGGKWPPSKAAGNYSDATYREKWTTAPSIDGYTDGFATTAPVMSFKPNSLGIFDLGGNAWEWVADWWNVAASERVLRGGSWFDCQDQARLASSHRNRKAPTIRSHDIGFRIVLDTRAPASTSAATKPATPTPTPQAAPAPAPATAAKSDFTNSLGMKFVKVTGTKTLFCIHETRYKDYAAYAAAVPTVDPRWKNQNHKGIAPKDRNDDHPVVIVSWEDAQAFCAWLSQKEGKRYRLPTDEEWSYAVGIGRDEKRKKGDTPGTIAAVPNEYPWGTKWPPSKGCENYGDESYKAAIGEQRYLTGYDDGYPTTAPVMSFKPNRYGLYDMGGNVSEWCEDWLNNTQTSRVLRGSSWKGGANDFTLLSSARGQAAPATREDQYGFRIIVETTE